MISIVEKKHCCGCTACVASCPTSSIAMTRDEEGFEYPIVDDSTCTHCHQCERTCSWVMEQTGNHTPRAYACQNKEENIRQASTSGGVFSKLAEDCLDSGGIVVAAMFNSRFEVVHDFVNSKEGLAQVRGTKYSQSRIGDCFRTARSRLDEGRNILFSGTPCQIAGFKKYLGGDHPNLLAVGIICHSVPSPGVLSHYLASLISTFQEMPKALFFRKKEPSWKLSLVTAEFHHHRYQKSVYDDPYTQGFLAGLYSRPSCHQCHWKQENWSDLTLGDYWGLQSVHPDMDDDLGTSLVLVHTEKGDVAFDKIREGLMIRESEWNLAIHGNPYFTNSVPPHPGRTRFFQTVHEEKERQTEPSLERFQEFVEDALQCQ